MKYEVDRPMVNADKKWLTIDHFWSMVDRPNFVENPGGSTFNQRSIDPLHPSSTSYNSPPRLKPQPCTRQT